MTSTLVCVEYCLKTCEHKCFSDESHVLVHATEYSRFLGIIEVMDEDEREEVLDDYTKFMISMVNKDEQSEETIADVFEMYPHKKRRCRVCPKESKRVASTYCFGQGWLCQTHNSEHEDEEQSGSCKYKGSHTGLYCKTIDAFEAFKNHYANKELTVNEACKLYPCTPYPFSCAFALLFKHSRIVFGHY